MRSLATIIFLLGLAGAAGTAHAADQKTYDDCNSVDFDRIMSGCTILIQDKAEAAKNRAIAFSRRGRVLSERGEDERALADLNQALALAPNDKAAADARDYLQKKKQKFDEGNASLAALDGTWEGEMKSIDLKGDGKTTTGWNRLVIKGKQAQVFYKKDDKIIEVKAGHFRVERHLTNAIVFAIDSALDDDGIWVETWTFTVTPKDRDTLIVNHVRVVNNVNLPLTRDYSKFSVIRTGELLRK